MPFIVLLFFSFNLLAKPVGDGKWEHLTKKNGIDIYTKTTKESPIQYLRARGTINASVENICAIMRNVEFAASWTPNLLERSYVENISDLEAVLYDITNLPWPAEDREIVLHHKLSLTEDKQFLVLNFKSIDHPKAKRNKNTVRATVHHGEIKFRPAEKKDTTFIEMVILVDPAGSLPAWLVNLLQVSIPYEFLMALNEFAQKTEFKPLHGVQDLIDQLIPGALSAGNIERP